jgi:hypothetical protein
MAERTVQSVVITGKRDATTVELPWKSRQALLNRLASRAGTREIAIAIKSAGQCPVSLGFLDAQRLLQ